MSIHDHESEDLVAGTTTYTTKIINDDLNPVWDEIVTIPIVAQASDMLKLTVFDEDLTKVPLTQSFVPTPRFTITNASKRGPTQLRQFSSLCLLLERQLAKRSRLSWN